ncbi:MAG TPA: ATP-binding protein [Allosphingosinicella sp.]|jgi:signal transduction histidine kinase/CheY-like chemotaxis protein
MRPLTRLARLWPNVPLAAGLAALLVLAAGLAIIFENEAAYRTQKGSEIRVQAEILAASVSAALDFGDAPVAQEAVDALRVNSQLMAAGVYTADGQVFASYERSAGRLPRSLKAVSAGGGNAVEAVVPVTVGDARIGSVYLNALREPLSRRVARYSVVAALIVMAALVVLVLGLAQTALRRANKELEARAEALSAAYAELQVQVDERARAEEQLRQAQKMQALGQLTGGIAHDFNNLLTVIQGSADILRRPGLAEEKRVRFAEAIVETAGRAAALTAQLLAFARRQPLKPEVIDLNAKIRGMTNLLDRTLGERIRVETALDEALCTVKADPAQLEAALLNVAVNARDAMPDGGTLTISTGQCGLGESAISAVFVAIADTGAGIEPEILERVFEPFFTTKSVGRGTGLGLSQVYGFAAQSGGDVTMTSKVGEGTVVTVILPCSDEEAAIVAIEARASGTRARRSGRLLVVDDNEDVGAFAEALLGELGYDVVRVTSGAAGLAAAADQHFDAVFTDVVMPEMTGIELAERLREVAPKVKVVLTTGYSDEITRSGAGGRPVVYKPYRLDTLAQVLEDVLAQGDAEG